MDCQIQADGGSNSLRYFHIQNGVWIKPHFFSTLVKYLRRNYTKIGIQVDICRKLHVQPCIHFMLGAILEGNLSRRTFITAVQIGVEQIAGGGAGNDRH